MSENEVKQPTIVTEARTAAMVLPDQECSTILEAIDHLVRVVNRYEREAEKMADELCYAKGKLNAAIAGLKSLSNTVDVPWPFRDPEIGGSDAREAIQAFDEARPKGLHVTKPQAPDTKGEEYCGPASAPTVDPDA